MMSALSKKTTSNAISLISLSVPRYCLKSQSFDLSAYQTKRVQCQRTFVFLLWFKQERKDKAGSMSALQQIVSPYGKVTFSDKKIKNQGFSSLFSKSTFDSMPQTDTASVLLDAMHYIEFLHEQVKVCILFFIRPIPLPSMALLSLPNEHLLF